MKKKFTVLAVSFLLSIAVVKTQSIAYVSQDTLLMQLPGYIKALTENDSLNKYYSAEVSEELEKLNNKINNLFTPYNPKENETVEAVLQRLSNSDKSKFELLRKESEMLDEKTKTYNELVGLHYNEKVMPLLNKLNKTIADYAAKNKIDAVLIIEQIGPALAYINQSKNITNNIIILLK